MKGTIWLAIRLVLTAALVLVTCLGVGGDEELLDGAADPPAFPGYSQAPHETGRLAGQKTTKLDAETFVNTGANVAVERHLPRCRGPRRQHVPGHFDDPDAGVYHSPINCYRSNGWRLIRSRRWTCRFPTGRRSGHLSTWECKGETILVAFWYRLGDHTLFERWDMGRVRWAMSGQKTWPPLVKVLLQTPTSRQGQLLIPRPASRNWPQRIQTVARPVQCGGQTGERGQVISAGHRA